MSVGKSDSLLRRDARAFCNKRHQRTIWEARRDERRTNQQLERELRHLERSRSYRERELDRDQVKFLNSFVEIFQKQCDIVAQRKAQAEDAESSAWKDDQEDDASQYDDDDYYDAGQDSMTVTTSDQVTADGTSGVSDKAEENPEIHVVADINKRKLRLHRDSLLPIIYSPNMSEDSSPQYSSRPNSPRPNALSPSELDFKVMSEHSSEEKKSEEKPSSSLASPEHPQDFPRSAIRSPPREVKVEVSAPVYRRRLSPLNRFKIPESHFRAESPSSKNSTIYVNDVPDIGGSIKGDRMHRRTRLPPPHLPSKANSKLKSSKAGRKSQQRDRPDADAAVDEMALNTKFMLEFEEASRNALDPYATGADIEAIRKQFLVNTIAKKLKISALRSGHFAELDDIRKKIERRRKCVEEILEAKRKERRAAAAAVAKEAVAEDEEDHEPN